MEQKKNNIRNVKPLAALLVIALVAMFSLESCGDKKPPTDSTSDMTTDSLAVAGEQAGGNHAEYEGISLDMSIDEFRKALENEGYALGEKDPAHKMIKMYNQFEALWVYYDSETNKVWNVVNIDLHYEDMELGNEGDRRVYEILIPEYEQKYNTQHTGFCEGVDCIDIPGGCIIFAYDEILGGMIMTVDEANSNNYDNLMDTTYGISPYGLED